MGWFFGCFGGKGKKDRKRRTQASSPLPKPQKPSCTIPVRVPGAASSSIPIKVLPARDGPNHEDLFTVRQVSSSAPVRHTQGILLQDGAGSPNPEKKQKLGPWHQLDDLEEELEDLRKQVDRESQDAKKIREEVNFLKSCGTLVKTPSELKRPQQVDHQQGSVPDGGWRSWLAPSASPTSRTPPEKNLHSEGLRAALCEPTPAKECHGLLLGAQTPVSNTRLTQSTVHHFAEAHVHEESFNGIKEGHASNISLQYQDGVKYRSPVDMEFSKKNQSMPCSPHVHEDSFIGIKEGHASDVSLQYQDGVKYTSPVDVESSKKNQSMPRSFLHSISSRDQKEHCDNMLDDLLQKPNGNLKQDSRFLCDMDGSSCKDAIENDSNSTKKRRLVVNAISVQSPHAIKKPVERDIGSAQDKDALCQKRLKVVPGDQANGELRSSSLHTDPVHMHFFRCDSLSPIIESGTSIADSTSYNYKGVTQGHSHQVQDSYNSACQTLSQSPSLRQSPASQSKSVTFASTNDEDYTTDDLSYNRGAVENYSEESYTNSTCINDTNEEDELATGSYSPSIDSEETLSDLSPERCFSPPISPSHERNSTIYRSRDSSASRQTAKNDSFVSTQYSYVYGGRKKQHFSRYDSEEDERTEDDYELFTDAVSHVSTECSEKEHRKWHSRTESMDSVSAQFAQLGHPTDSNLIDTPPKLSAWIATPNVNIQGKHTSRLRSKPASSVLTPVENVSQWKQLKEKDHKLDVITKAGSDGSSKADPSKQVKDLYANRAGNARTEIRDENKSSAWIPSGKEQGKQLASHDVPVPVNASLSHWGPRSEAEPVNVNASLSHWGTASKVDSIRVDASLSQWSTVANEPEPARVDMSLSHWLKSSSKHAEAQKSLGTSSTTSSSAGGGVISPAPQTKNMSPSSSVQPQRRQSMSYVAGERPILGALGGDYPSGNAKQRSPWDGKGTPNSTAKYMEDQRVKWQSIPFEQRLEKALDQQGILLQKKRFAVAPAAV